MKEPDQGFFEGEILFVAVGLPLDYTWGQIDFRWVNLVLLVWRPIFWHVHLLCSFRSLYVAEAISPFLTIPKRYPYICQAP